MNTNVQHYSNAGVIFSKVQIRETVLASKITCFQIIFTHCMAFIGKARSDNSLHTES